MNNSLDRPSVELINSPNENILELSPQLINEDN